MGYSPFYQAIPEDSGLSRLLMADRKAEALFILLFPLGSRPLDIWEAEEDVDEEVLAFLVEGSSQIESIEDAKQTMTILSDEINRTCSAHPGLMDRVAFVEKTLDRIERRLAERLDTEALNRVRPTGEWVFGTDARFTSRETSSAGDGTDIIYPPRVKLVSALLKEVEADSLFSEDENRLRNDFQVLKDLYREAANRGEAILVC